MAEGRLALACRPVHLANHSRAHSRHRHPAVPAALFATAFGFALQVFFDLGEMRTQLEQAPQVSCEG
jgi:hypothetical protein